MTAPSDEPRGPAPPARVCVERLLDERHDRVREEREVRVRAVARVLAVAVEAVGDADDDRLDPLARESLHRLVDAPFARMRGRLVEEVAAVLHDDDGKAAAAPVRGRQVRVKVADVVELRRSSPRSTRTSPTTVCPSPVGCGSQSTRGNLVVWPVTLPGSWVASTKPAAVIVRRQGWKPCQGRGRTLAPRDRGPGARRTLPVRPPAPGGGPPARLPSLCARGW